MSQMDHPPIPAAPPTSPDPSAVARRKITWPTVVGIIAIVFAAGGLMTGLGGVVSWLFAETWRPGSGASAAHYRPVMIPLSAVHGLLAGLLLAGGIGLIRQRRWAVRVLLTWAWLRVVEGVVNAVVQAMMQREMFQQAGAQSPGMPAPFVHVMTVVSFVFALAWAAALPVFLLIWFRGRRVRGDIAEHFDQNPGRRA